MRSIASLSPTRAHTRFAVFHDCVTRVAKLRASLHVRVRGVTASAATSSRTCQREKEKLVSNRNAAVIVALSLGLSATAHAQLVDQTQAPNAARAGIVSFVLIPEGKIALGKLAQAIVHGAEVLQIAGNFDDGMQLVKELSQTAPVTLVNSVNPHRLQGQKTAAFEIVDTLGRAPDYHCLPVGNAGNISAYWMGYAQYHAAGRCHLPVMAGYQAAGAAPFVAGHPIEQPETIATAIRIGNPQSWDKALAAQRESGGWFAALTDDEILAAQKLLAMEEGVFCEPASAASIGGALRDLQSGRIPPGKTLVCTLTGNGLKDPDIALRSAPDLKPVKADRATLEAAILRRLERG